MNAAPILTRILLKDRAASALAAQSPVQFPAQTLAYRSGAVLDWGILYAASLEASGIGAALIPLPQAGEDGCIAAVNLGIGEAQAASLFNGLDKLLLINDILWLPVSMDMLNQGFTAAREDAAAKLTALFDAGEALDFIILADAWASYPPAPFPSLGVSIAQADTAALKAGAGAALNGYIASDIEPLIAAVNGEIRQSPTAALYNRLGILQVRAGNTGAARSSFQRAAGMGSEAARRNLENLQ